MTDFFSYLFHIQIDFVSNDYKWEVVRVTWTCLYKELIAPAVKGAECSCLRHVVHQDAAVSTTVERNSKTLEPLLARCVPYLAHTVPDYASTTNGSSHYTIVTSVGYITPSNAFCLTRLSSFYTLH